MSLNFSGHMWLVATVLGSRALDPALCVLRCETLNKFLPLAGKIKGCNYIRIQRKLSGIETEVWDQTEADSSSAKYQLCDVGQIT